MANPIPAVKKFVARHKTPLLVTGATLATAVITTVVLKGTISLQSSMLADATNFIASKDLDDEFLIYIIKN